MNFEHNISILGSTGSIGTQTLEVARAYKGIRVHALSAYSNIDLLEKQTREFNPRLVCVFDEKKAEEFKIRVADTDVKVVSGRDGLIEAAVCPGADTVVTAVVGISGLLPTIEAIKAGKNIALANKETLVTGGHIVTRLARENNVKLLPVDSEHSAIFQSLQGNPKKIKKILLTASGGPFFGKTREELKSITPEQALKHPNWDMGAKVTIDSSTLVNKGLEVIEAKWLFDVDIDKIEVLVHRQSVLHSAVMYEDNAVIAQLGVPDMKLPIQYALTYPDRLPMQGNELDFTKYPELTFAKPDTETFYALELAKKAGREGGILPTVFNGSDEAAVELFLKGKIGYLDIADSIADAMDRVKNIENPSVEEILEADKFAREAVYSRS
ncbi:MAG: 1-deoxy-D-xylulose-5-phosphate reductoisomerase [Clostridia bacterium]|nr:1-deoxy-D-xylulose-5-phosphate reductoisomerase [Clostridia bacterium]